MNISRVLILGGTGFVGRHVCEHLARLGVHMTVPTRRAVNAAAVQSLPRLTVVEADIHDPVQLEKLMQGHDAVVNLVAILHGDAAAFDRVHVQLPRTLAKVCKAEGVTRLVHVSALGADPQGPSLYQRSKAHGEQVLQQAVQTSDLALTLLRPSVIFGTDDAFINLFAKLQAVFPVMPLAGAGTRFQPVWVQDVAQAIVHAVLHRTTVGHIYDLVGPEVLTLKQLVEHAGLWAGHPRWVFALPHALAYAQALVMEMMPGAPLMSRDNLASMQVANVAPTVVCTSNHLGRFEAFADGEALCEMLVLCTCNDLIFWVLCHEPHGKFNCFFVPAR